MTPDSSKTLALNLSADFACSICNIPRIMRYPRNSISASCHNSLPIYCLQIEYLPIDSLQRDCLQINSLLNSHPISYTWGLHVKLQIHLISSSKCISIVAWSRPPSVSPLLLDDGLHAHLSIHIIIIWWNSEALMAYEGNACNGAVLAEGGVSKESERIYWTTQPCGTTHIVWINESLARVREEPHRSSGSLTALQDHSITVICIYLYSSVIPVYL